MSTSFITTVIDGLKETYKTKLNRLNISFINPQVTISDSGSVQVQEKIPVASKDTTGIVQIGEGIDVNEEGMISVSIPVISSSLTTEQTEQVESMISTTSQEIFSQVSMMIDTLSQGLNAEISSLKERLDTMESANNSDNPDIPDNIGE